MASITKTCKHPKTAWDSCSCQWYVRSRVGGSNRYVPVGKTRAEAERNARKLDAVPQETMRQAVALWLDRKAKDPAARANSLAVYRSRAKHITNYFGDMRVSSVRPEHIVAFVDEHLKKRRPATVQSIYAALTSVLRGAQRRGVIAHLPVPPAGPGIPTAPPRQHALTLVEVEEILERMPGVWGKVAELVYLTGLRWGEVVAIEPGDIDGHVVHIRRTRTRSGTLNPPKTRAGSRVVPLSSRAREILERLALPVGGDYRRAREALVAAMNGGDEDVSLHKPGMGWHSIRAAHATLLDKSGVSLRESAARMGHGHNFAQTLAYGIRTESDSDDVIDDLRAHLRDPQVVRLDDARRRRARRP
jgi:integrase